ncbi:Signal transduction histidine kinase [Halorubrum xinjiangense]|uniref:histidine kinase n=1 Tax=Halorubrum xinjiangense TaxID=261291 RepID=A0A1G7Q707_9EURY|nr:Signal transduction histidine kinase [Halorubrum xinjiangense]
MDDSGRAESNRGLGRYSSLLPGLVFVAGSLIFLIGIAQGVLELFGGGSVVIALFNLILVGIPGTILMYAGYWMPRSDIEPEYYPRVIARIVGGTGVMFGFILLRDLHPGVTVEWSVGTQSIALMIGSIGGLLIGIQESKVRIRTEELEARTCELKDRERHLERQNERLDQFSDVVSHDLRNPLNVASGRLELAREECDSDHLADVENAHDRMEALITDLLTLARQDQSPSEWSSVRLADLAEGCWRNVQTEEATLRLVTDGTIRADESRTGQLFENLIRNGVEHVGSDVTVTVGDLDDGFYLEDDGPGIPPGERGDVFKTGHTTSEQGTGFGLSIVEQIVEAHDWEIRITEGTNGGARFEVTGVELAAE